MAKFENNRVTNRISLAQLTYLLQKISYLNF